MNDQHRADFLLADGLDDWVVLHGGPTAVYLTKAMSHAAQLAQAVAELPGFDQETSQLSIVSNRLTVRLTREVWNIKPRHIDLARSISALAEERGAVAEPGLVHEVQVAVAAKADKINLEFWRAVLGYSPMLDDNAVDPLGFSSTFWMQEIDNSKTLRHAMHIDVSASQEIAEQRVKNAIAAGGVVVDESGAPGYWILADSSGNKVCLVSWPNRIKESQISN